MKYWILFHNLWKKIKLSVFYSTKEWNYTSTIMWVERFVATARIEHGNFSHGVTLGLTGYGENDTGYPQSIWNIFISPYSWNISGKTLSGTKRYDGAAQKYDDSKRPSCSKKWVLRTKNELFVGNKGFLPQIWHEKTYSYDFWFGIFLNNKISGNSYC